MDKGKQTKVLCFIKIQVLKKIKYLKNKNIGPIMLIFWNGELIKDIQIKLIIILNDIESESSSPSLAQTI